LRRIDTYVVFLMVVGAAFIWSAIRPLDYGVWLFELSLGLLGVGFLVATRRTYPFSGLAYGLAAVHFVILACGAKYTYAEMPLFNWLRDAFHLSRNHFDRVGHLAQGFIPAIFVRELLRRTGRLQPGWLLGFLSISVCLAFSAFYEILEWWVVIMFYPDASGTEWLGMQGDPWDAQEDMLMALIGAGVSILTLSSWHERSMARPTARPQDRSG
jgi:putative membrane protein